MSVRRLADESVQPASFAFTPANLKWAKEQLKKYPNGKQASAVIPVLWRAQEQNDGWVSRAAMEEVGKMLDMPFIRVYEIATFYTMFQLEPVGKKAHVQVCGTTPCMLRGSEELMKVCRRKIAENPHQLSADGDFSWEEVECLGACVNAPMIQIWKDTYEDLTPEALEDLLDKIARGQKVKPGPQIDRIMSAPEGGPTTLTGDVNARPSKKAAASKPAVKVPPSRAAKPKTAAPETANGLNSPSEKKVAVKSATKVEKKAAPAKTATKPAGPERLARPQGKADDLKLISGVGPKLEGTLNRLGFWHFSQIAKWTKKDIAIVDDELSFKGRIERDDWVKQAKALAKGGEAEYVKVFGKKPR
ncbi:MAG: NADH-quinone oxidoreductase subunit NuoE [Anderseniella sp.]|nr:NADH-quinone oxidoreductase subunit NuoE [Anderseniella sp.]